MRKIKPFLNKGLFASLLLSSVVTKAEQAINDPAPEWDHMWDTVILDISIMGVLFGLLTVYFVVKYRRRDPNQEGNPPKLTAAMAVGWALIPAFIFMADDFYLAAKGWQLWNNYRQVPADRMEIQLESGMYSWDYTYPNGVHSQNELRVPAGKPIMLRMTSRDVVHSHYIHAFRVKEDSMPGRVTYLWFYPKEPGEHIVSCNEYCGIMHSYMTGKVIVMPENDFNQWYEQAASKLALATGTMTEDASVATPAETAPATPVETAPAVPAETVPATPVETAPAVPVETAPAVPVETAPATPVETTPVVPAETAPVVPAETAPAVPAETAPAAPAETAPATPVETAPAVPAETAPATPVETTPVVPAETAPTAPAETAPVAPSETPTTN